MAAVRAKDAGERSEWRGIRHATRCECVIKRALLLPSLSRDAQITRESGLNKFRFEVTAPQKSRREGVPGGAARKNALFFFSFLQPGGQRPEAGGQRPRVQQPCKRQTILFARLSEGAPRSRGCAIRIAPTRVQQPCEQCVVSRVRTAAGRGALAAGLWPLASGLWPPGGKKEKKLSRRGGWSSARPWEHPTDVLSLSRLG